jgi:polyhydroxyalkanoate synthesis regulator phasin
VAENGKEQGDTGVITKLSKAGEDALNRFAEELGRNERVTDAVARAMAAKDKVDDATRRTLGQVGVAAADEIKDLRKHLERLEKRLAALEQKPEEAAKPKTATARPKAAAKPKTAAKKSTSGTAKRTSSPAKASEAKKTES